jgi:hypothetical protein
MSEGHEGESSRGGLGWALAVAFVPLLYVLSVGPVGAIAKNNTNALPAVRAFYSPVAWLHDHTLLQKPLEAYANLWGFH